MKKVPTLRPVNPRLGRVRPGLPEDAPGWGQGRGPGWAATRQRIMLRDGHLCQCPECKASGRPELAHVVDHLDNRRGPGYDDDSNLAAMNRDHHDAKTKLERLIARGLAPRPAWMDRTRF